jgi:hypothetical protein
MDLSDGGIRPETDNRQVSKNSPRSGRLGGTERPSRPANFAEWNRRFGTGDGGTGAGAEGRGEPPPPHRDPSVARELYVGATVRDAGASNRTSAIHAHFGKYSSM